MRMEMGMLDPAEEVMGHMTLQCRLLAVLFRKGGDCRELGLGQTSPWTAAGRTYQGANIGICIMSMRTTTTIITCTSMSISSPKFIPSAAKRITSPLQRTKLRRLGRPRHPAHVSVSGSQSLPATVSRHLRIMMSRRIRTCACRPAKPQHISMRRRHRHTRSSRHSAK